jgi:hypothetical protein
MPSLVRFVAGPCPVEMGFKECNKPFKPLNETRAIFHQSFHRLLSASNCLFEIFLHSTLLEPEF